MAEPMRISATELKWRMGAGEQFTLIDTRNPEAWGGSDVKAEGALRIPVDQLEQNLRRIPGDKPIVTYCT